MIMLLPAQPSQKEAFQQQREAMWQLVQGIIPHLSDEASEKDLLATSSEFGNQPPKCWLWCASTSQHMETYKKRPLALQTNVLPQK